MYVGTESDSFGVGEGFSDTVDSNGRVSTYHIGTYRYEVTVHIGMRRGSGEI